MKRTAKKPSIESRLLRSYIFNSLLIIAILALISFAVIQAVLGRMIFDFSRDSGREIVPEIAQLLRSRGNSDDIQEILDITAELSGFTILIEDANGQQLFMANTNEMELDGSDYFNHRSQGFGPSLRSMSRMGNLRSDLIEEMIFEYLTPYDDDPQIFEEFRLYSRPKNGLVLDTEEIPGGVRFLLKTQDSLSVSFYPSNSPIKQINGLFLLGFLIASLFAILFAFILAKRASRRLIQPLKILEDGSALLSTGDLGHRVEIDGDDEIARLAVSFNHMAGQLQSNFSRIEKDKQMMKNFLADASHELRTPITAATTFVELLSRYQTEASSKEKGLQQDISEQLKRMKEIAEKLLQLSQLEQKEDSGKNRESKGGTGPSSTILSLLNLLLQPRSLFASWQKEPQDFCLNFAEVSSQKEVQMKLDQRASLQDFPQIFDCELDIPEEMLRVILQNIIQNALLSQTGEEKIWLFLGLEAKDNSLELYIADSGPGISKSDLSRIVDRFYRSVEVHYGGSGLGLSIVKSIAEDFSIDIEFYSKFQGIVSQVDLQKSKESNSRSRDEFSFPPFEDHLKSEMDMDLSTLVKLSIPKKLLDNS